MICEVNMKCIHMNTHDEYEHVDRMHTTTLSNQCARGIVSEQYVINWTSLVITKSNQIKFSLI